MVTKLIAGTGISVNQTSGNILISNTGVTGIDVLSPIVKNATTGGVKISCPTCGTGSGTVLTSQNVGKATGSIGVLAQPTSTTIKGRNFTGTSPIIISKTNDTDVSVSCPSCITSSGVTQLNSFTGKVNLTGSTGNVTVTNSSGTINFNTGNDIPHLTKFNNFTDSMTINPVSGTPTYTADSALQIFGDTVHFRVYYDAFGQNPTWLFRRADGTMNSPTKVLNNEALALFAARPFDGSSYAAGNRAAMQYSASEDWSSTKQGTNILFLTTNSSTTSTSEKLRVNNYGGIRIAPSADVSSPTNGDFSLSTTNTDVMKYRSSGTTFNIQSTKNALNFTAQANRTGTSSLNGVMLGEGTRITPAVTGRVEVVVSGFTTQGTATDGCSITARYGTGISPINGATVTGTLVGSIMKTTMSATTTKVPFTIPVQITGLALGTAIWIELTERADTGGTCTINNVMWTVSEV